MIFFILSFLSISLLHVRRRLPYIVMKEFKTALPMRNKSWTNAMEKLSEWLIYVVHLVPITWIPIVVCIVIANTKFVTQRRI